MEESCQGCCASEATYICVCLEKHLCDECLLAHVSESTGFQHRPVSMNHPLLTLLLEGEHETKSDVHSQVEALEAFRDKTINLVNSRIEKLVSSLQDTTETLCGKITNTYQNASRKLENNLHSIEGTLRPNTPIDYHSGRRSTVETEKKSSSLVDSKGPLRRSELEVPKITFDRINRAMEPLKSLHKASTSEKYYKIALMGDSGAGKTVMLSSFMADHGGFTNRQGISYASRLVNIKSDLIRADVWNVSSASKFKALSKSCLFGAHACVVLFDLTNELSFFGCDHYIKEFKQHCDPLSTIILVGNKLDLTSKNESLRFLSFEQLQSFASEHAMLYDEVSCLNKDHVSELFERLVKEVNKKKFNK